MRYLSLFSGIEAATVAWHPLGWECVGVAEIEPFPCSVLAHYYPNTPNLGDVTKLTEDDIILLGPIDIIVFGSPCQDLSIAGKRAGLEGERSGLFHDAIRITDYARKHCGLRFALWENVPGAFSSNRGADFAVVVGELAGVALDVPPKGWGTEGCALGEKGMVEWSTLDAQWFGVAQRRRRVFALADFGNWRGRPPILLEPEGMRGDSAPRRETGQRVAGSLEARTRGGGFPGTDGAAAAAGHVVGVEQPFAVANTLTQRMAKGINTTVDEGQTPIVAHALPFDTTQITSPENSNRAEWGAPCHTLNSNAHVPAVAIQERAVFTMEARTRPQNVAFNTNFLPQRVRVHDAKGVAPNLAAEEGRGHGVPTTFTPNMQVRRLTPCECERLQAFPDDYTLVPHRGKPAADGPRYKALGNSMCVSVMRWIGEQIENVRLFQ